MADRSTSTSDEIEVAPEMVDAGSEALMPFYMGDGAYDLREPALIAVYRAMREANANSGRPTRKLRPKLASNRNAAVSPTATVKSFTDWAPLAPPFLKPVGDGSSLTDGQREACRQIALRRFSLAVAQGLLTPPAPTDDAGQA